MKKEMENFVCKNNNSLKSRLWIIPVLLITANIVMVILNFNLMIFNINNSRGQSERYESIELTSFNLIESRFGEYSLCGSSGFNGEEKYLTFEILDTRIYSNEYKGNVIYIWNDYVIHNKNDFIKWLNHNTVICYSSDKSSYFYVRNVEGEWKESGWINESDFWDWDFD